MRECDTGGYWGGNGWTYHARASNRTEVIIVAKRPHPQQSTPEEPEYLTVGEAQEMLGVTKRKIADLIERGLLPAELNPFDRRSKLVKRADVLALQAKMPAKRLAAA